MSKKDLSYYINKDVTIIKCKKRAKELLKLNKNSENKSLSEYKTIAAVELGFKNWFDLQNTIKKKCALKINLWEQELISNFDDLLKECLNHNSSDIHIEARKPYGKIRIRVNGEFIEYKKEEIFSYEYMLDWYTAILNKFYPNSNFQFLDFSQGSVLCNINNEQARITIQSVPAYPDGFDLIFRVRHSGLYKNISSLNSIGYSESHIKQILEITSKNSGCFILSGVYGQGKTTSLKTIANQLDSINKKIHSIENGFEIPILNKRINKIQCVVPKEYNPNKSIYEDSVKKAINNGAEIILIDGIKDIKTAELIEDSYKSALFITSVNTTTPINIIQTLKELNLQEDIIGNPNFCRGMLYQKLLPVLCQYCSKKITSIQDNEHCDRYLEYLETVKIKYPNVRLDNVKIRNYNGCSKCNYGINSRTACAEIVVLDNNMCEFIKNNDLNGFYNYWKSLSDNNPLSNNMIGKTAHEHAIFKMLMGKIDPLNVIDNFSPLK